MTRRMLWALLLIAVVIIILILNSGGRVGLNFGILGDWNAPRAIVYFMFTLVGAAIGILLR